MPRMIFPNLAVKNLAHTKAFWSALGFHFNPQFTDDNAACMVVNDHASVMLLAEPFFKGFTTRQICDTATHTEAIVALLLDSREEVTQMVEAALANGGSPAQPLQDHGFMFQWSFYDPDGHHWEPFYMNPAHGQPV
ncbi:VOC family protein [Gemmatimonas sp.]|uniref:VOC family protein n=1 Tax=Gemmatimonas sp. TaxID=1962908 RepID=UPI0027BA6150|nr:VOC family protein [Gemmatimonas sp.]